MFFPWNFQGKHFDPDYEKDETKRQLKSLIIVSSIYEQQQNKAQAFYERV